MSDVISFRPKRTEEEIIERTRRLKGFKTRSQAVRYLIVHGPPRDAKPKAVPEFRLPPEFCHPEGHSLTNEALDEELYGGGP